MIAAVDTLSGDEDLRKVGSELKATAEEIGIAIVNPNAEDEKSDRAHWRKVEIELGRKEMELRKIEVELRRKEVELQRQALNLLSRVGSDAVELREYTEFLANFRTAYVARKNFGDSFVVDFQSESNCVAFIRKQNGRYRYLIQQQYFDIWARCEKRFIDADSATSKQTVVVGTAGIGKSACRLLYITMWLEKEISIPFQYVIFNIHNDICCVDFEGKVRSIEMSRIDKTNSLLLLDPCNWLHNAQGVQCKMLIVFTSPSCLVGQPNKPCLTGLDKESALYVMNAPTVQEARKIYLNIDEAVLKWFSWENDGTTYCSLRWFSYSKSELSEKLQTCMSLLSSDGLWQWFITNTDPSSKDSRLPFRLCVVEQIETGWTVTGFLSPEIEQYVANWAMGTGRRKASELANLLENRALRGGLGIFFERWLFESLGCGLKLRVCYADTVEYIFNDIKIIACAKLEMDCSIIYKLDRATFPSVEGYVLVGNELLLLQSTVSKTHAGARSEHVHSIIAAADEAAGQRVRVRVVYIVLSTVARYFTLPQCKGFRKGTTINIATVDDSAFCHHSIKFSRLKVRNTIGDLGGTTSFHSAAGVVQSDGAAQRDEGNVEPGEAPKDGAALGYAAAQQGGSEQEDGVALEDETALGYAAARGDGAVARGGGAAREGDGAPVSGHRADQSDGSALCLGGLNPEHSHGSAPGDGKVRRDGGAALGPSIYKQEDSGCVLLS